MTVLNYDPTLLEKYRTTLESFDLDLAISQSGEFDAANLAGIRENIKQCQAEYFIKASTELIRRTPPFEWHPYVATDAAINSDAKTLLIGTFPPPSYLHKHYEKWSDRRLCLKGINIDTAPSLDWFYGNKGSLWTKLNLDSQAEIYKYLEENKVIVADIILGLQRNSLTSKRASDENLFNIIPNLPLVTRLIEHDHHIENIVFTSKAWDISDGSGKGRKPKNHKVDKVLFKGNSAIALFLKTLDILNCELHFKKIGSEKSVAFSPANFDSIGLDFTNAFFFELLINGRGFKIYLGDSPSGAAFTPLDSSAFRAWIARKHPANGLSILARYPRNKKSDSIKLERKGPIQRELGYTDDTDIAQLFLKETYEMNFKRNFPELEAMQKENVD